MKSAEESIGPRKGGAFDTGIREAWTGRAQLDDSPSCSATNCGISAVHRDAVSTMVDTVQLAKLARSSSPKALHQMTVHLTSEDFEFAKERAKGFRSFNAYVRHALAVERASGKPKGLRLSDEEIGCAVRVMIEEGRKP